MPISLLSCNKLTRSSLEFCIRSGKYHWEIISYRIKSEIGVRSRVARNLEQRPGTHTAHVEFTKMEQICKVTDV